MKLMFLQNTVSKTFKLISIIALLILTSCAGTQAYNDANTLLENGMYNQGLAKLEEAVKLEPKNIGYKIALANRRAAIVDKLLATADIEYRANNLTDAEKNYRQVQVIEPENSMAKQGMENLVRERRHQQILVEANLLFKKGTPDDLNNALDKIRPILAENPEQNEALNLKARIDDELSKQQRPEAKLAETFRKSISLEFRDAPLKSVLEVLSKVSKLNFFYDKDIRPDLKVTVFAKDTSVADAMRLLLVTNQLREKVLNDNSILIYPNTAQKLKEYQTLIVRSFYLTNADAKSVANSIKTIVKSKDIITDERLGIIIVRDTPEAISLIEKIVALQDLSDPEVMLDVQIMEVKRSRIAALGIQWPGKATLTPLSLTGGTPLTLADLVGRTKSSTGISSGPPPAFGALSVTANANTQDTDSTMLANPRIRVRNKEKAQIKIGDRVPEITQTQTSTGFSSGSINYIDVGLTLKVQPTIYLDNNVAIKMSLEVSHIVKEMKDTQGTTSYQIGTRNADTVLRLKDGETQILAGLISDDDSSDANKVPGLGEFPILGRLFGSTTANKERTELLLSITPHIVRSIRRPDMLAAEFDSGTASDIGGETLRLSKVKKDSDKTLGATNPPNNTNTTVSTQKTPVNNADSANKAKAANPISISWQVPAQVKVGEQFSAVLHINSQSALLGMPVLLGFDPQVMQVMGVSEGEFFKSGNGSSSFSQRVDAKQGRIFAALVRQNKSGKEQGINGDGSLLTVKFKSLKASNNTKIQLLSATPNPAPASAIKLPIEHILQVVN